MLIQAFIQSVQKHSPKTVGIKYCLSSVTYDLYPKVVAHIFIFLFQSAGFFTLILKMSKGSKASHNYSSLRTGEYDEEIGGTTLRYADSRIKQQDESLEKLGHSLNRIGELSLTISKEIDTQNRLLSSLDTEVEHSKESSEALLRKTKELVAQAGGNQIVCAIIVLLIVLVLLTLWAFY